MTACCPGHDPFIQAGFIECPTCDNRTFPSDAVWLDSGLILATYAPACSHVAGRTFVLDPALLSRVKGRCVGVRVNGQPCRGFRMRGTRFCRAHLPREVR